MATPVTQILRFSPSGDISSNSNRRVTCLARCDIFAHASGSTDDRQKRMLLLLLHTAGGEVGDICATSADTGAAHDEAVAPLNAHFPPQMNVTFQKFFRDVFHR